MAHEMRGTLPDEKRLFDVPTALVRLLIAHVVRLLTATRSD